MILNRTSRFHRYATASSTLSTPRGVCNWRRSFRAIAPSLPIRSIDTRLSPTTADTRSVSLHFLRRNFLLRFSSFCKFCTDYYAQKGYRSNLLYVGYRIAQDQKALLSYSYDGTVMTLDPVSTANPGWDDFLAAYNQFCVSLNGKPLLNQTPGLTAAILQGAYGNRVAVLEATRKQYDPQDRLLNNYFRGLLS